MTTPKFRAWHKEYKRIFDVLRLDFVCNTYWVQVGGSLDDGDEPIHHVWDMQDCELMQWTGKKDQKNVDIYEGDILEHANDIYVIQSIFPLGRENEAKMIKSWSVHAKNLNEYNTTDWISWCEDDWEIIGNIYENPELLNKDE